MSMERFDRAVARWSAIVALIAGAGAVVSFVAGVISEIKHFPAWAKIPLIAFLAVLVVVVVLRVALALRHRKRPEAVPPPGGISMTGVHAAGDILGTLTVGGTSMRVVPPSPAVAPLEPIASTPELLLQLANELDTVRRSLLELVKRDYSDTGIPDFASEEDRKKWWEAHMRAAKADIARVAEAVSRYQVEWHPRVVQLYEEAKSRGFSDEVLGREVQYIPPNAHGVEEIATRLGVIAERVRFTLRTGKPQDRPDA